MKTDEKTDITDRRLAWVLLTGVLAVALVAAVSLCLSHVQVRAEPLGESAAANFEVIKEVNQGTAAPGDVVVYTVTVENSGNVSATAWLTDRLPAELSYVSDSLGATLGTAGVQDKTITWTAQLIEYQTAVLTFSAEVSSEVIYANVVNTAQVTGTGELVEGSAPLVVVGDTGNLDTEDTTKDVSSTEAEPGDTLTYTIRIENTDSSKQYPVPNVHLTDTLPTGVSYVSGSLTNLDPGASLGYANGVITWSNTLDYLSFDEIQFSAEISTGVARDSWLTNHVQIEAPFQAFTRSVGTYIRPGIQYTYMPLTFKGWPPRPYAVDLADISNADMDGNYTISWSYDDAYPDATEPDNYTLQEATTADLIDWTTIYDEGPNTSYDVTNQPAGTYYYRARGHNAYGDGTWSNVQSVKVGGEPLAPTLNEIPNEDQDQSYRVSWTYDQSHAEATRPDSYLLQEARDEDFTEGVENYDPEEEGDCVVDGTGGYCDIDNDSGTYYYRVRGENQDGTGPWSNVEDVYVWEYEDDFSDYESGWPRVWEDTRGALYQVRPYEHPDCPGEDCKYDDGDGYIIARRMGEEKPLAQFTPDVEVPSTNYQLEVDARWFEGSVNATYVIYFSSEDDFDSYYAVKVRIDDPKQNPPECDFKVYKHTEDEELLFTDWTRSDSIHCGLVRCREDDPDDRCGSTNWNEWKIERDGENGKKIRVEVNGDFLGQWSDHDPLGSDRVFGFGATNYEGFTPSKPVFDQLEIELQD